MLQLLLLVHHHVVGMCIEQRGTLAAVRRLIVRVMAVVWLGEVLVGHLLLVVASRDMLLHVIRTMLRLLLVLLVQALGSTGGPVALLLVVLIPGPCECRPPERWRWIRAAGGSAHGLCRDGEGDPTGCIISLCLPRSKSAGVWIRS